MKEKVKTNFETATGIGRPKVLDLALRARKPAKFNFKDDGDTPNNPNYPLIVYRSPVALDPRYDPAAIFEVLFGKNKWGDGWRATMYGYNHFHTQTHECLGIARGKLTAQFGGTLGRKIKLRAGDVVIIPAGVGHRHIKESKDLLIVGAYPANAGKYDEPKPEDIEHVEAQKNISRVKKPATDPVYGQGGPLLSVWQV